MTMTDLTVWQLPLESLEWVGPIAIYADGVPVPSGWTVAVAPLGSRPLATDYAAPDATDGGSGVTVGPTSAHVLTIGVYRIWAKLANGVVLDDVGIIVIE